MFLLAMFITLACEENLELEPLSETEADYFDETIDFERAAIGVYARMSDLYWFNNNSPLHAFWLLPGDDLTSNGSYPFEVFSTIQPGQGDLNTVYNVIYVMISRANVLLQKIAADEEADEPVFSNTSDRDALKGEALFLRGWCNFFLWNYFGTSPNITERIQSADGINPPSSAEGELLDQAIADFQAAAPLLPKTRNAVQKGRATSSSAYGYQCKALVFKASYYGDNASYTAALQAFNSVDDKSLIDNYGDNFSSATENNEESVFEYQAAEASYDNVWLSNDFNQSIGSFSAYYGYFDDHWSFWAHTPFVATEKFLNEIDTLDPRTPYIVDVATGRIQKYMLVTALTSSGVASVNNPRLLRYADLLLLAAEARNETGDASGALALINQVRARARNMGSTGVPADLAGGVDVRQAIMDERFIELAAEEGHRWLDLRRWHKAGWINLSSYDFSSIQVSFNIEMDKHLLWPIPTSEVDLNPEVRQNPGY